MRHHQLDLNLLLVLDALVTHQNVSRAARYLHVTQPTVSNALARLREHFEDELLVPVGRRMVLTPLAESLGPLVSDVLRRAGKIALSRPQFDPVTSEVNFSIVASDYICQVLLNRVAASLAVQAPSVSVSVLQITDRSLDMFSQGTLDFAILPDRNANPTAIARPLFTDPFVPIAWTGSSWTENLTFGEFCSARHIVVEFGALSASSIVENVLRGQECERRIVGRVPNFSILADFIVGTPYLATLPFSLARRKAQEIPVRILQPDFELPTANLILQWHRDLGSHPASVWFRNLVSSTAASLSRPTKQSD